MWVPCLVLQNSSETAQTSLLLVCVSGSLVLWLPSWETEFLWACRDVEETEANADKIEFSNTFTTVQREESEHLTLAQVLCHPPFKASSVSLPETKLINLQHLEC